MEAILELPSDLPPHDAAPRRPVPARTVFEWPLGTFVENLAPLIDGSFAVSVLSAARIDQVWPDGRCEPLAQFDAPVTGLVRIGQALFAAVGVPDRAPWSIRRIDLATRQAERLFDVDGAVFLNGVAALSETVLLASESVQGRLLGIDLVRGRTSVWLDDERLTPTPEAAFLPGANGLKCFGGHAYVASNGRALFCRVPIVDGLAAGRLAVVAERLRVDDFAFDADGNAYLATHIGHSLDRLSITGEGVSGERISLGGAADGLAGSTACAFGITAADREALYVTTTGGIIGPVDGTLQPARLVRLAVGATGAPLVPEATR